MLWKLRDKIKRRIDYSKESIRLKTAGAELGTQTWTLHPVVTGSIPVASTPWLIKNNTPMG